MGGNWYVVANRVLARFFRETRKDGLQLFKDMHNPRGGLKTGEIISSKKGSSGGVRLGLEPVCPPKKKELISFAREIASDLDLCRHQGKLQRLALVADAQVLGALRECIPPQLHRCIYVTLQKNLGNVQSEDIALHLQQIRMPRV